VEDAVLEVEGVDLPMAVKFGENEICTIEDLAGLTPDDLRGWYETRDGERVREPGILEGSDMSAEDAEMLIMRARVIAGWISEEDLPQVEPEAEEVEADALDEEASDVDLEDIDLSDLEAEAEKLGVDLADLLDADTTEEDEKS
jgi:N utilization substance protein A